jgi:universal stress protein E
MIWRHVMLAVSNVDSTPTHVIDRVGRIARGLQAEVELFSCLYEPDVVQPGQLEQPLKEVIAGQVEDLHRRLERLADELRDQGLSVRCSVRWDYPTYEGVIRQALRHNVDLLIVPAGVDDNVGKRTLHYREARLIETCPCPLLLLKTLEVYSKGCIVAAVDPLHVFEVPGDLDEAIVGAAKTLSYALAEMPVRLYHADVPMPASAGRSRAMVHERVRELAERHNIAAGNLQIEAGTVEKMLPAFTHSVGADVLVMGAISRSYPGRALMGHKAERVLDAVSCDVLIVKPRGFQCPVEREPAPAVAHPA